MTPITPRQDQRLTEIKQAADVITVAPDEVDEGCLVITLRDERFLTLHPNGRVGVYDCNQPTLFGTFAELTAQTA